MKYKKHQRHLWKSICRGTRSRKSLRKLEKQWISTTKKIDGVNVKVRRHAPKSKAMNWSWWWV